MFARPSGPTFSSLPGIAGLVLLLVTAGCARERPFLWADGLRPQPEDAEYRAAKGDVLSVRVWNQESMSTDRTRVREDGKISVPFLQDVQVAGMTTGEISSRLAERLKTYVVNPVVTVSLEERRPVRVSVLGEVTRAGTYEMGPGAGVLNALAAAGGLTDYARRDRIFVLRNGDPGAAPARIRFTYEALARGVGNAAAFRLRSGDVVVVE